MRPRFTARLENSGDNPFLREHLPQNIPAPSERGSITVVYAWPAWTAAFGLALAPYAWIPNWLAWTMMATRCVLCVRGFRRIDVAWRKAARHYNETEEDRRRQRVSMR